MKRNFKHEWEAKATLEVYKAARVVRKNSEVVEVQAHMVEEWGVTIDFDLWKVATVVEGCQFEKLGVKVGWVLSQVNGIMACEFNREKLRSDFMITGTACTMLFISDTEFGNKILRMANEIFEKKDALIDAYIDIAGSIDELYLVIDQMIAEKFNDLPKDLNFAPEIKDFRESIARFLKDEWDAKETSEANEAADETKKKMTAREALEEAEFIRAKAAFKTQDDEEVGEGAILTILKIKGERILVECDQFWFSKNQWLGPKELELCEIIDKAGKASNYTIIEGLKALSSAVERAKKFEELFIQLCKMVSSSLGNPLNTKAFQEHIAATATLEQKLGVESLPEELEQKVLRKAFLTKDGEGDLEDLEKFIQILQEQIDAM